MTASGVVARVATAIIVIVVVIVGGILAITEPDKLSYAQYFKDVSTGVGLLAIGYGIDAHSKP